jgi:mannan endo-1,4-beta-mannosidase
MKSLARLLLFITVFILPACCSNAGNFVYAQGTQLMLGGSVYKVAGDNYHFLQVSDHSQINEAFDTEIPGMHLNTVRLFGMWSAQNGNARAVATEPDIANIYFQDYSGGAQLFNDGTNGMQVLDYILFKARDKGIKIIFVLQDDHGYHGGVPQYLKWLGYADDRTGHDLFYSDSRFQAFYKNWASHVLNHTNCYTGVAYKNDPTVLAWELMNEASIYGPNEAVVWNWYSMMARYIKSIDTNHLVADGGTGFFNRGTSKYGGTGSAYKDKEDFVKTLVSCPGVDIFTFHCYPQYDDYPSNPRWANTKFIPDHYVAGSNANVPVLMEEFGWDGHNYSAQVSAMNLWCQAVESANGCGWNFWDGGACNYNGADDTNYTVSGGEKDDVGGAGFATPYNSPTGVMLKAAADRMIALATLPPAGSVGFHTNHLGNGLP